MFGGNEIKKAIELTDKLKTQVTLMQGTLFLFQLANVDKAHVSKKLEVGDSAK